MRSGRLTSFVAIVGMALAAVAIGAEPASASYPGAVGRIAFDASLPSGKTAIFTVNPDGSDLS